ncbi:MAG: hypothetical protein CMJ24_07650 [Phycisphaerae bacterium]|nr:hypothetical protein [Phycisphaerae bacterium]MDG1899622.1 hypothetical protein [Phycisphaerales bacterium]|tara:strand:+ start:459 stop:887 length:429 start_codon:yes stop_codon:yes gene_type:complete
MGQIALGVRSLLIRLAIFFVMAILLAWALGGTLWPRPVTAQAVTMSVGDATWSWTARITSYSKPALTWLLAREADGDIVEHREGWLDAIGFVETDDGLFTAALDPKQGWVVLGLKPDGNFVVVDSVDTQLDAIVELVDLDGP